MVFGANIFICIRVLSHLKYWVYWGFLSSKLNKMYKNHSSFWNRFFSVTRFIICTYLSALLLFITWFFQVNLSVNGLSGKNGFHGS